MTTLWGVIKFLLACFLFVMVMFALLMSIYMVAVVKGELTDCERKKKR